MFPSTLIPLEITVDDFLGFGVAGLGFIVSTFATFGLVTTSVSLVSFVFISLLFVTFFLGKRHKYSLSKLFFFGLLLFLNSWLKVKVGFYYWVLDW